MVSVYCLFDPMALLPTEEVDPSRVEELQTKILSDGRWTDPITAHKDAHFVMDGHHRLTVAKRLNLTSLPVVFLGYEDVRVSAWRDGETITPQDIFAMAQSGRLFPFKTTRHILNIPLAPCDLSLERLGLAPRADDLLSLPTIGRAARHSRLRKEPIRNHTS